MWPVAALSPWPVTALSPWPFAALSPCGQSRPCLHVADRGLVSVWPIAAVWPTEPQDSPLVGIHSLSQFFWGEWAPSWRLRLTTIFGGWLRPCLQLQAGNAKSATFRT
ncbi:hypothetical protein DPX16_16580 [Anabarilius grahami]|uniref:Uncharacterized protein n=1 Tax=Anabarilius grahami TaxID=495550 RepID=A0A3N0XVF9_ANAGA|nr:hypothetical protein DPX16_16580 [Anabarilius grahami]